jgi:hypothetical protein
MKRSRWTSFVAADGGKGRAVRQLCEEGNPRHRLRVEHDGKTLLIHLSDEDGPGWTTIAVDRASRSSVVARGMRQMDAAVAAYAQLERKRAR